ncbi:MULTISPECIES: bifunctional nuclease family protein [Dermacoccus]|uniref:Bifunctional nuclease family protein n=1 Tax=Dermacoccus abyssi TaxID=322596 RepID=A0ABX5Z8X0_9MICO|nr:MULTISPECIES: bifunctional nuclease family protein [Dermacoccus]MBZ4496411.1 bifunctional nuclease family protein [Dermacoccus sp. Tok2021]QEH93178.1 bifunctional nuclease family protein [Dermacoccus abyssi]KLO63199.1 hypothetical protein AA983_07710 [Dermacoccus sp. PE3]MBE7371707.1 bifunctional nuclease family protein [Dermacoccus barathri]QNK52176.1 bifunctional nuclease family protein [Dermacoccus sp. PAMC28757]
MKRAEVSGIRVELPTTSPVLLLRIEGGVTHVPIWIGSPEASMIALFAEGVDSPRPLTHDLVLDVAGAAGRSLERVEITALRDDVYEASLVFDDGGRVDSRASDAVALAMRASVDIFVADAIVDEVGVQVADEQEEEVEKFREFLDHVSAEDFEEPEE